MRKLSASLLLTLLAAFFGAASGQAASRTWDGGGGDANWTTAANWDTNVVPATTDDVTFGTAFTSGTTIGLNGSKTANSLTINTSAGITIQSNTLTLTSGSLTRSAASTGSQTISSAVTLGANATWNIQGTGTLAVNGVVNNSGTRTLTKTGAGTLVLGGANLYDGATTISGGTLSISSDGNLGDTGTNAGLVFNGGTLQTTGGTGVTSSRAITLGAGGGVLSLAPPLNLSGAISGGTGLTTGGSDLILNRASGNNAIGAITVNSGRLFVFTMNSIAGSSIAVGNGAILDFSVTGGASPANAMTFTSGGGLANRAGTLTVSTTNATFPTAGTMIFNSDDQVTTPITASGTYPTLTGDLTIQVGGSNATVGAVTLSGAISGSGGLIKTSTGTLNLGSANGYTGGTTVSAGTLDAQVSGSLSSGTVSVASGATLKLDTTTGMSSTSRLFLSGASPSVNLNFSGTQTIGALSFDGGATFQAAGTWGSLTSTATHKDSRFTGNGILYSIPPRIQLL